MVRSQIITLLGFVYSLLVLAQPSPDKAGASLNFCPPQAALGEDVVVAPKGNPFACPNDLIMSDTSDYDTHQEAGQLEVRVGGVLARVTGRRGELIKFRVPTNTPGGDQLVEIISNPKNQATTLTGQLGVIGDDIIPNQVFTWFKASKQNNRDQIAKFNIALGNTISAFKSKRVSLPRIEVPRQRIQNALRNSFGEGSNCFGNLNILNLQPDIPVGLFIWILRDEMNAQGLLFEEGDWGPVAQSGPSLNDTFQMVDRKISSSQRINYIVDEIGLPRPPLITTPLPRPPSTSVVIAILDTGVAEHYQLGSRLIDGYDVVNDNVATAQQDNYIEDTASGLRSDGHGTPVAVLAAGSSRGVAPQATVLPIKVCDPKCLASDVFLGICYALAVTEPNRLVLNLSLGGASRVDLIRDLLEYAIKERGVLVAAAAGAIRKNIKIDPSTANFKVEKVTPKKNARRIDASVQPTDHVIVLDDRYKFYPAAYAMPGMLAVGGLEKKGDNPSEWRILPNSLIDSYIQIYAPGGGLVSGNPRNGLSTGPDENTLNGVYMGTSFASPVVSGALALLRAICPTSSAQGITQLLINRFRRDMGITEQIKVSDTSTVSHPVYMLDLSSLSRLSSSDCP